MPGPWCRRDFSDAEHDEYLSGRRCADEFRKYAKLTEEYQNSGKMDAFVAAGIEIAQQMHVTVCDCYKEWKKLYAEGVDTTKLLINRLTIPLRKCTVFCR